MVTLEGATGQKRDLLPFTFRVEQSVLIFIRRKERIPVSVSVFVIDGLVFWFLKQSKNKEASQK